MAGIQEIAKAADLKSDVVSDVFEALFQLVRDGQSVRIAGFGSFDQKVIRGRVVRSSIINGGKPTKIPESIRMVFRQSAQSKDRLNRSRKKKEREAKEKKPKRGDKKLKKKRLKEKRASE